MNSQLRACITLAAAIVAMPASALTLSFDDLPLSGGFFGLQAPALYQGFDFSNSNGETGWRWDTDAPPLAAGSPPISIRTAGADTGDVESAVIASATAFTFTSAFFSGVPTDIYIELVGADGTSSVRLGGFDLSFGDPAKATFSLTAGTGSQFTFVNPLPDFALSRIVVSALEGTFALDDLVVTPVLPSAVEPVPEPETFAMMLAGLACIAVVAYRRRPSRA